MWQPAPWLTVGESNALQRTPDLTPLVQAIVSRPGWVKDNAMAFLFTGTGHRTADAYEQAGGTPARLTLTYKMPAPLLTNTLSIAGSDKDVEQAANGTMNFTSTDLELVRDEGTGAGDQTIGLRFENLTSADWRTDPQRKYSVLNGRNEQRAHHAHDSRPSLRQRRRLHHQRQRPDNPSADHQQRRMDAAAVEHLGERAAAQRTPDLAALVGEVVARPSWASGNPLVFIINGVGKRVAESFDKAGGTPAALTITYHARPISGRLR